MNRILRSRPVKIIVSHIGIAAVVAAWSLLIGCPSLRLLSLPCPLCGMTRACIRLVLFDFSGAWYYHPLAFVIPAALLLIIHRRAWRLRFGAGVSAVIGSVSALLLAAVYIVRMFVLDSGFLHTL